MAAFLEGANDLEKLHDLCKRTHKQQAVWFLNAFWDDFAKDEAEKCWNFVEACVKIDNSGAAGNELDEMEAHRFLEKADEAHTVLEMRSRLRKTGAIGENERPKAVPLVHYLLFKYDDKNPKLFHECVSRAQGDNQKQIEEAQAKLDAVSAAFEAAEAAAAAAAAALKDAQSKEADAKAKEAAAKAAEADAKAKEADARASEAAAKAKEADAKQSAADARAREESAKASAVVLAEKEEEVRKSQAELEAALAEVKKQEDAYNTKTATLTAKSEDESLGVVTRNRTKNELAQHLAEDPLPLRQAKITAEAALRKAEKATKAAGEAKAVADQDAVKAGEARAAADADASAASAARAAAEDDAARATASREAAEASARAAEASREAAAAARAAAEQAKAEADAAVDAAQAAMAEAEAFLEEEKKKPGNSHGALWWIDRELHEKKKYMPMRKGGIAK